MTGSSSAWHVLSSAWLRCTQTNPNRQDLPPKVSSSLTRGRCKRATSVHQGASHRQIFSPVTGLPRCRSCCCCMIARVCIRKARYGLSSPTRQADGKRAPLAFCCSASCCLGRTLHGTHRQVSPPEGLSGHGQGPDPAGNMYGN